MFHVHPDDILTKLFISIPFAPRYEKPLWRLLQRLQTVVFQHLKTNVRDRSYRISYDLDSSLTNNLIDFGNLQKLIHAGTLFIDTTINISLEKTEYINTCDDSSLNTIHDDADNNIDNDNDTGNSSDHMDVDPLSTHPCTVIIKEIRWASFEKFVFKTILSSNLPLLVSPNNEVIHIEESSIISSNEGDVSSEWNLLKAKTFPFILHEEPWLTIIKEIDEEHRFFEEEKEHIISQHKVNLLKKIVGDHPSVIGSWKKTPDTQRVYNHIEDYVVTCTIPEFEQNCVLSQLKSSLPTEFRGPAYDFDDGQLTEEWMCSFKDKNQNGPTDDDVIKVLTKQTLENLLGSVQDRVCTELGALQCEPLYNANKESCHEQLVWGIDCATRYLIEVNIRLRIGKDLCNIDHSLHRFIDSRLLPAINAQPPKRAHNMLDVASYMVSIPYIKDDITNNNPDEIWKKYTQKEHKFAQALQNTVKELGIDLFRIHPKGTGVICAQPGGIKPHQVICEYIGELYPPYKWCERLDVLKQAQQKYHLKPTLPDFYNILLERPRQDSQGYGLLYVDASEQSNIGSTLAHSCDNNCTSAVVTRNGKLTIVITSLRFIAPGEEITHDYSAVTASEDEWRASVCLCGMSRCRGYFLHYSDEGPVQTILENHCGPLWRYAALLRSCGAKPLAKRDIEVLEKHGIKDFALGVLNDPVLLDASYPYSSNKLWMQKFAADILRYIEHERSALPCALLRNQKDFVSTFVSADWDARSVMEQRIQSLCSAFSMAHRVLSHQSHDQSRTLLKRSLKLENNITSETLNHGLPLKVLNSEESASHLWSMLSEIPPHLLEYIKNKESRLKDGSIKNIDDYELGIKRLKKAARDIKCILNKGSPNQHNEAKKHCRYIQSLIHNLRDLSDRLHRLGLLADILLLWSHVTNFSRANLFDTVKGENLTIVARELGSSISRSHVEKFQDKKDPNQEHVHQQTHPSSVNMDANEAVFTNCKTYDSQFVFWQMMQWFHAGSEKEVRPSDLFGTLQLPQPHQCFGACVSQYGAEARQKFINLLRDEKKCALPWPQWLKSCFSQPIRSGQSDTIKKRNRARKLHDTKAEIMDPFFEEHLVCGSPMLDVSLGLTHAVKDMLVEFNTGLMKEDNANYENGANKRKRSQKKYMKLSEDELQPDDVLPPEDNTAWVQCDKCHTWRRLPWNIDADSLSDNWHCALNTWDSEKSMCGVEGDAWDPDCEDITNAEGGEDNSTLNIGDNRDIFCLIDEIYYEGTVVRMKAPYAPVDTKKEKARNDRGDSYGGKNGCALFKFKFFGNMFREWIELDSDRIRPVHMFSSPTASCLAGAQAYQGLYKAKPPKKKVKSKGRNPFTGVSDDPWWK